MGGMILAEEIRDLVARWKEEAALLEQRGHGDLYRLTLSFASELKDCLDRADRDTPGQGRGHVDF